MIKSKNHLIKYIRSQLGEPTIQIELTDEQIGTAIDDTISTYTDVAYGDYEDSIVLDPKNMDAYGRFSIPEMSNVLAVGSGGIQSSKTFYGTTGPLGTIDAHSVPAKEVHYHWNNIARKLTITSSVDLNTPLVIIGLTKYQANDDGDYIFNETWVKAMTKAQTQKLWGHVVGKYSQNLVGGATINYDRLISEAQTEIDRLMEELHDKWVDPAPVMVV